MDWHWGARSDIWCGATRRTHDSANLPRAASRTEGVPAAWDVSRREPRPTRISAGATSPPCLAASRCGRPRHNWFERRRVRRARLGRWVYERSCSVDARSHHEPSLHQSIHRPRRNPGSFEQTFHTIIRTGRVGRRRMSTRSLRA